MPPNGTAGFARSAVSGLSRLPSPPARTMPSTRGSAMAPSCPDSFLVMRIGILTREWPPQVYGGAGVHVEYLTRALSGLVDVEVHSFGGDGAILHDPDPGLASANAALRTLSVDLRMADA